MFHPAHASRSHLSVSCSSLNICIHQRHPSTHCCSHMLFLSLPILLIPAVDHLPHIFLLVPRLHHHHHDHHQHHNPHHIYYFGSNRRFVVKLARREIPPRFFLNSSLLTFMWPSPEYNSSSSRRNSHDARSGSVAHRVCVWRLLCATLYLHCLPAPPPRLEGRTNERPD